MLLQIGLMAAVVVAVIVVLIAVIFLLNRRAPQPQTQRAAIYTPGEQEILSQLAYLRERIEKFIPPYGQVGYVPASASELAQLLGFKYIKIGQEEHGILPEQFKTYVDLDIEQAQIKIGNEYLYIVKKDDKKLIAVGEAYLDYLTLRFLEDFLTYM
ncbi:MAG: hypothetical protein ABWJ97_00400 [Thermoproteus sp.]